MTRNRKIKIELSNAACTELRFFLTLFADWRKTESGCIAALANDNARPEFAEGFAQRVRELSDQVALPAAARGRRSGVPRPMSIANLEQLLPRTLAQAEMQEAIVAHLVSLLYVCDAHDVLLEDALAEAERRYLEIVEGGAGS